MIISLFQSERVIVIFPEEFCLTFLTWQDFLNSLASATTDQVNEFHLWTLANISLYHSWAFQRQVSCNSCPYFSAKWVFGVFILLKFAVESRYDLLTKRNQVNIPQPKLRVHLTGRRLWLLHCEQPEVRA